MNKLKQLFSLLSLFLILRLSGEAEAGHHHHHHHPKKLFVFGDSYADTGNIQKNISSSWKYPYGITFPGKPAGRFSDGRVLTDYIAKHLKVKSPIPYRMRKVMWNHLKYGMNFAFGGSGVFQTLFPVPNMTTQIDFFQQLIEERVYNALDLSKSLALVSAAGNDYAYYLATNGSAQGFPYFVGTVVKETIKNVVRIKGLGVQKIVISALQPLGCLPSVTAATSYEECNETSNALVLLHNTLLNEAVKKLNEEARNPSTFLVLNLYDSFMWVLNHPSSHHISNNLKPCCVGVSNGFNCGDVDKNKVKMYRVCNEPQSSFFWDLVHPTQAGWHAVYNKLRTMNALQQIH